MSTIAFIGSGNMAEALIKGIIAAKLYSPESIFISDIRTERLDELARNYGVVPAKDNAQAVSKASTVVLSVKPQTFPEALASIKDAIGTDATYSTHMADQGTDAQEREKAFYYASREHRHLNYLNEALERVKDGSYGICISCGKDIPKERLEAVPITQHCVPCKMDEKQ